MALGFLTENEQNILLPYLQEIHLGRGRRLFKPGDTSDGVFFLTKGQLGVQTKTGFEDKQQVVALLDPDAPLGEKGVAENGRRGMTVVAIKILKKLLVIASLRLRSSSYRLAHVL